MQILGGMFVVHIRFRLSQRDFTREARSSTSIVVFFTVMMVFARSCPG